jgi:hypothetical protein
MLAGNTVWDQGVWGKASGYEIKTPLKATTDTTLYFLVQLISATRLPVVHPRSLNNWQMCMSIAELQQSPARGSTLPVYSNVQNTKIIFEVRHPRCVRQITKLNSWRLKVKNKHTHTHTQQTIVNSLHVSASNKPSSGCTPNEKG